MNYSWKISIFFILLSNKRQELYNLSFQAFKRILTQQNNYDIDIFTIITDQETALINVVNNNFKYTYRIGCWYHYKVYLLRQARIYGLLNKHKKIILK